MPTIYAVASVKGGVGKTTTAANLAATLAAAGYDAIAVDADLGSASLGPTLGVEPGEVSLHDVLAGEAESSEAIREGPHDLAVLPGGTTLEAFRKADPEALVDVLESITEATYVIVDTGAGLTHQTALPLSVADAVLLVSTPTRDGLGNTRKTQDLAERLGGTVAGIALNRAEGDEDTGDIDVPVLGAIPDDATVADAQAAGSPLAVYAPDSDAAAAYRSLASSLTGEPIRPAPTPETGDTIPDDPEYGAESAPDSVEVGEETDADASPETDTDGETVADADTAPVAEAVAAAETTPVAESDADGSTDVDDDAVDETADAPGDGAAAEPAPDSPSESDTEATQPAATAAVEDSDEDLDDSGVEDPAADDAAEDPATDDAVILDDEEDEDKETAEDEAGAAARTTVLDGKEYAAFGEGPATVEDAESGESAEIGEDVIPFAQQSKERTEEAKQRQEGEEDDEPEERKEGGILGRLFR